MSSPLSIPNSEREQLIISLYYREELTMKEIAEVVGVALSRVSQIRQATMKKLRESIASRRCPKTPGIAIARAAPSTASRCFRDTDKHLRSWERLRGAFAPARAPIN